MLKSILTISIGLVAAYVHADDLLPANRPNFSSNGEVVPLHMSILETGTTYQRQGNTLNFSGIEGELRTGFSKGWEFDFFLPNYVSGASPRGWGDSGFQVVRQLRTGIWNVVLGAGATLPSGQSALSAGAINPTTYFSADHDLGGTYSLTETFYVNWQHQDASYIPSYSNALMIAKDLGKNLGVFVELYSTAAPGAQTGQILNFGYTFAHNAQQQVDFHFGRSIAGSPSNNWFIGAGYSKKLNR